ncbi:GNAT family N-acetyltransferase [Microbulbifer mangrovi]|uniref:GNAT family N-acetyltransferase n=1 Tax=Microbulbifer mangrovi TaxID=927787 RepID=UPI00099092B7|nr:GNAT family N-acetyltransferase [Microbulbifer mangrovi]
MQIEYKVNEVVSVEQFRSLLDRSTLAERRPVDDAICLEGMLKHSDLTVSAWFNNTLVGIARSVTDFNYACYLSDLAVDSNFQKNGIGRNLLSMTQEQLGPKCKLILIAAPAANLYYDQLGFENNPRCWVLDRDARIAD